MITRCSNCKSERRPVQSAGLCAKCYYWHRKRTRLQHELATADGSDRSERRVAALRYRARVADRVLAEYEWRETHLQEEDLDLLPVLALLYAVAGECRSEVSDSIESELGMQSPETRHCIYSILLDIVENIPSRLPRLHTFDAPKRGQFPNAWLTWASDYYR